jgi:hypothetical protein
VRDDLAAKTWEVWRNPSANQLYFRSTLELPLWLATCANGREVIRIKGSTLQSSIYGHIKSPQPLRRFESVAALWRDSEARLYFSRHEVDRALRTAEARSKPSWVREFERYGGIDAP